MMTNEQEKAILEETIRLISETSEIVDLSINLLKKKEKYTQLTSQKKIEVEELEYVNQILNFRILIGFLILDLSTTMRNLIRAEIKYEEVYSLKQMVVILKEGYQKIYNFTFYNKNGDLITKERNQSLWKKGIGEIIKKNKTNLNVEYDLISEKLDKYYDEHFFEIKEQRDLSVHYDKKSMKVYSMLTSLKTDELVLKIMPFLKLLNELLTFTEKLVKELNIIIADKKKESVLKIEDTLENIKKMIEKNNLDIDISPLKNIISKIK